MFLITWASIPLTSIADSFRLDFENDFFIPGQLDRNLSNRVELGYDDYVLGNEMYTPRDKRNPGIPDGDRPWDGYTYFGVVEHLAEDRDLTVRIGILGDASGTDSLQRFVHGTMGLGVHPVGWSTQNPSEPALDVIYSHKFFNVSDYWIGQAKVTSEYGVRFGNVKIESFVSEEIKRGFFYDNWEFYVRSGIDGRGVAFDTTLDGRMFHDNTYTVERVPFVASTFLGVGTRIHDWLIEYQYRYLTEEFKGQDGRHAYAQVLIGKSW